MDEPEPARDSEGTPRWVKVFAAVAIAVVLLFVVVLVVKGPGGHGPGRHALAGDETRTAQTGEHTLPPGVHTQP